MSDDNNSKLPATNYIQLRIQAIEFDPQTLSDTSVGPFITVSLSRGLARSARDKHVILQDEALLQRKSLSEKMFKVKIPITSTPVWSGIPMESLNIGLFCRKRVLDDASEKMMNYYRDEPLGEAIVFMVDLIDNASSGLFCWIIDPAAKELTEDDKNSWYDLKLAPIQARNSEFIDDKWPPGAIGKIYIQLVDAAPADQFEELRDTIDVNRNIDTGTGLKTQLTTYTPAEQFYIAYTGRDPHTNKQVSKGTSLEYKRLLYGSRCEVLYVEGVGGETLTPYTPECMSVHCPFWYSGAGPLMAPLYSIYNDNRPLDESFVRYMLSISANQHGLDLDGLKDILEEQLLVSPGIYNIKTTIALKVICEAACLYANACDYVPDISRGQLAERFLDAGKNRAGDCEDLSQLIRTFLHKLRVYEKPKPGGLFFYLKKLLNCYQVVLTTAAVTAPSASAMKKEATSLIEEEQDECYNSHMFVMLLPNEYLSETLLKPHQKTSRPMHVIEEELRHVFEVKSQGRAPFEKHLPVLFCEGTNVINPLAHHPAAYAVEEEGETLREEIMATHRARLLKQREFAKASAWVTSTLGQGAYPYEDIPEYSMEPFMAFYRRINEVWLDLPDHIATYASGRPERMPIPCEFGYESGRYSVDVRGLLEKSNKLRLMPLYAFSSAELSIARAAIDRLQPIYCPSDEYIDKEQCVHAIFTKNKDKMMALYRLRDKYAMGPQTAGSISLAEQLVGPYQVFYVNNLEKLDLKEVEKLAKLSNGFNVIIHPITADCELYLVELRFK